MEPAVWERIDVSSWQTSNIEQSGSHQSSWLIHPQNGVRWLHKSTTLHSDGFEQGEDWAEVIATQVAYLLGVPVAKTRLCVRDGRRGSLSEEIHVQGHDLIGGHMVLEDCPTVTDYIPHLEGEPAEDPERPGVRRPGHNLRNIREALRGSGAPPGFAGDNVVNGFDVFVGYLLLDALVANRDRHEENWSQLRPQLSSVEPQLCPSYDHSGSLGFAERLAKLEQRRTPEALLTWAKNGTAWRFEHARKPITLVELAVDAMCQASTAAQAFWKRRLDVVDLTLVTDPLKQGVIPDMSEPAVTFVINLLHLNLERIRHELSKRR